MKVTRFTNWQKWNTQQLKTRDVTNFTGKVPEDIQTLIFLVGVVSQ